VGSQAGTARARPLRTLPLRAAGPGTRQRPSALLPAAAQRPRLQRQGAAIPCCSPGSGAPCSPHRGCAPHGMRAAAGPDRPPPPCCPASGASWVPGHVMSSVPHGRVELPFSPGKPYPALGWSSAAPGAQRPLCRQGIPHQPPATPGAPALPRQRHGLKVCPCCPTRRCGDSPAATLCIPPCCRTLLDATPAPGLALGGWHTAHGSGCPTAQDAEFPSAPAAPRSGEEQQGAGSTTTLRRRETWPASRENSMGCAAAGNRSGTGQAGAPTPGQTEYSSVGHPYGNQLLFKVQAIGPQQR